MEELKIYTDKSGWTTVKYTKEEALNHFKNMHKTYCLNGCDYGFAKSIDEVIELSSPFKSNKCIYNAETFLEYCSEMLDYWLENAENYIRPVTEEDEITEEWTYIYTHKGQMMVDRAINRLTRLGEKHFGELTENISCSRYQEG